jgi:hypothetical protein
MRAIHTGTARRALQLFAPIAALCSLVAVPHAHAIVRAPATLTEQAPSAGEPLLIAGYGMTSTTDDAPRRCSARR